MPPIVLLRMQTARGPVPSELAALIKVDDLVGPAEPVERAAFIHGCDGQPDRGDIHIDGWH